MYATSRSKNSFKSYQRRKNTTPISNIRGTPAYKFPFPFPTQDSPSSQPSDAVKPLLKKLLTNKNPLNSKNYPILDMQSRRTEAAKKGPISLIQLRRKKEREKPSQANPNKTNLGRPPKATTKKKYASPRENFPPTKQKSYSICRSRFQPSPIQSVAGFRSRYRSFRGRKFDKHVQVRRGEKE